MQEIAGHVCPAQHSVGSLFSILACTTAPAKETDVVVQHICRSLMDAGGKKKKGNRRDVQEIVERVSCAALGQQSVFDSGLQHPVRKRETTTLDAIR